MTQPENESHVVQLQGRWLLMTRALWILYAGVTLLILLASLTPRYHELARQPVANPNAWQGELSIADVGELNRLGGSVRGYATWLTSLEAVAMLALFGAGVLIFVRRSRQWNATICALGFIGSALKHEPFTFALEQQMSGLATLVLVLRQVAVVLFFTGALTFPDGRFVPRWSRWLAILWCIYSAAVTFAPQLRYESLVYGRTSAPVTIFTYAAFAYTVAMLLIVIGLQIYRYRHILNIGQRQQTKWVLLGMLLVFSISVIGSLLIVVLRQMENELVVVPRFIFFATILSTIIAMPGFVAIALLRYRLWDIDLILNRTLVYAALTILTGAIYAMFISVGGLLAVNQSRQVMGLLLATGIALQIMRPTYHVLQGAVNRVIPISAPTAALPVRPQNRSGDFRSGIQSTIGILVVIFVCWVLFKSAQMYYQMLLADIYGFSAGLEALGLSLSWFATYFTAIELLVAIIPLAVAALIAWKRSDDAFALLVAVTLTLNSLLFPLADGLIFAYPQARPLFSALRVLVVVCFMAVLCLFPNGRFVPKWTTWLLLGWVVGWMIALFTNPAVLSDVAFLATVHTVDDGLIFLPVFAGISLALIGQSIRYRRHATTLEKQQMKWLLFGVALASIVSLCGLLLPIVFPTMNDPSKGRMIFIMAMGGFVLLVSLIIPISIALAILRYRLWNIDVYLNRTLVYGTLTMLLLGLYALIVSSLGLLLHSQNNLVVSLFATAIIAIVFQPARTRLQSIVKRWLFGERDDPEGVLTRLTSHLADADSDSSLLANLVETIAVSLKLPYVALRLQQADGTLGTAIQSSAIQNVQKPDHIETLPLMHQQTRIGQLEVAPRSPGETLSTADQQLLAAIARLAATSIRTIQLSNEVQEARARIVAAREEERRRLRRDLHDGLGPVLAALTLQSETAHDLVRLDPTEAESLMTAVADQAEAATHEIRRLVYDLRPPALDDLGLLAALRSHAVHYGASGIHFHFDLPDSLPPLPAAVEVALYRIVGEALNNVMRHAQAHHCWVTLQQQEQAEQPSVALLTLTIVDDGKGLSTVHQAGVGILSMRERCVELGGTLQLQAAGSEPLPGLRIIAQLPLTQGIYQGR